MLAAKRIATCFAVFAILALPTYAGVLDGHIDAFNDGNGPASGAWTGSVPFSNGPLLGTLDFAVFTAADYTANFGGSGYTPGDALVYTYQVNNTGDDAVSAEIVGIANPANTIGSFDIGDIEDSFAALTPNATWQFLESINGAIATGETSWGLAFSSPNVPMNGVSLTIDGGASAVSFNVPTPSATPIPEPSLLVFLATGGAMLLCWMRRRR